MNPIPGTALILPRPAALVLGLSLLWALPVQAQARSGDAEVRGSIVTPTDEPIGSAIVELRVRGDSAAVRSTQSNEAGRFQFPGIAEGVYYLQIRRIGFGPATTPNFTVTAGQIRDVGKIRLQSAAVQLATIEVTVERPDVRFDPDRTGYLAEALTSAAGGVVTDALRQLPDVELDIDGTIRLRGATPAIYINGRPAPMQGVSLSVFLEQFPVDRIERIEVLDAPGARYSAEGAAGIINIVLKQGVELGMTGSLSFAAGTRGQYSASGHGTLQRGPWVFNGGLDSRWSDSRNSNFILRQNLLANPVTFLQQDALSNQSNRNGGMQLEARYELSKKSRLSARFGGNLNGSNRDGLTETSQLDELQAPTLRYERRALQNGDGASGDLRIGYEHIWQADRHEFEILFSAQKNHNGNRTREEIAADSAYLGSELLPAWLTRKEDGSNSSGAGLELNYTRPMGRQGRVEVGSSLRRSSSRDDQETALFEAPGSAIPDEDESRRIARVQHIGSLYLSLQQRLGKFGIAGGLRGEWVGENVHFPLGETVHRNEAKLFPNLNVNWSPRPRIGVRLGYSQRIGRPGMSVLDPTNRSTDPLNRSVGNPDIKSSTSHNVTLGLNWSGKLGQFTVGPYWNRTNNGWERVTTVDTLGVSTFTYENLTARTNLGASLGFAPPRVWGWTTRVNFGASRSTLKGSLLPQGSESGKLRWSVGGNLSGPVIRGIIAQGNFGFETGRDLVQGRTSGQWRADFSFRYRLMNNRTSIGLSMQDPFELRKSTQQIRDASVIQTGRSRVTTRSVTINLSYAFGGGRGGSERAEPVHR